MHERSELHSIGGGEVREKREKLEFCIINVQTYWMMWEETQNSAYFEGYILALRLLNKYKYKQSGVKAAA
jgi:hypothetical protein